LGKPLIAYTIEQALESKFIDDCIVSTDSKTIAEVAIRYGARVPFIRPRHLARDNSGTLNVLIHALDQLKRTGQAENDILVLLHCTTPLRTAGDIDACIRLMTDSGATSVFSVTEAGRNPYFNMVEIDKCHKPHLVKKGRFLTRQAAPRVYDMNSSIYVWKTDEFRKRRSIFTRKTRVYVMPKERSIDIDDRFDFLFAETILRGKAHG